VDDKIIRKAKEEGVDAAKISTRYIAECKKDMADMNIMPATKNPLATEEIDGMEEMIQTLIDKNNAYASILEQKVLRTMESSLTKIWMNCNLVFERLR